MDGRLYLFQVAGDGEEETVWVGADGWVVLPKYATRRMTRGEKALEAWAAGSRPPARPFVDDSRPF